MQEIATKTAALTARDAALARLQQSLERLQQEGALDAHHQTSAQLEEALGRAAQLQRQLQFRAREAERMERAILQERRECERVRGEVALWRQLTEARAALGQAGQCQLAAEVSIGEKGVAARSLWKDSACVVKPTAS